MSTKLVPKRLAAAEKTTVINYSYPEHTPEGRPSPWQTNAAGA